MASKAIFVDNKKMLLPKRNCIFKELADSNSPDLMTIEALLDEEIIRQYDDKNGGMMKYMKKVSTLVRRFKKNGIETIQKAIESTL